MIMNKGQWHFIQLQLFTKKEVLQFSSKKMELKIIIVLSEVTQYQKDKQQDRKFKLLLT